LKGSVAGSSATAKKQSKSYGLWWESIDTNTENGVLIGGEHAGHQEKKKMNWVAEEMSKEKEGSHQGKWELGWQLNCKSSWYQC
jgi:hypothetical protein